MVTNDDASDVALMLAKQACEKVEHLEKRLASLEARGVDRSFANVAETCPLCSCANYYDTDDAGRDELDRRVFECEIEIREDGRRLHMWLTGN